MSFEDEQGTDTEARHKVERICGRRGLADRQSQKNKSAQILAGAQACKRYMQYLTSSVIDGKCQEHVI
jgi:hypothetical protein